MFKNWMYMSTHNDLCNQVFFYMKTVQSQMLDKGVVETTS